MDLFNTICVWVAEVLPFIATLSAFIYGVKNFFKKGKALYLQIVTMSMGCYAMGSFYHICQALTSDVVSEGFTAAYLGQMGFFLFLFTANFGQMDSLLDDKSSALKKYRIIALAAPLLVALTFIPSAIAYMPLSTKISSALVWLCAMFSSYFNFKHSIISDMGFGFVKAIRPYNISALILTFVELLLLTAWNYYDIPYGYLIIALLSIVLSILSFVTMIQLKKGVEAWTI